MKKDAKLLIGGQALRRLGHDRHTDDTDYLVWDEGGDLFQHQPTGDLINAAANPFLRAVWAAATETEGVADPQTLAELKAWSLIQHCQNMNFRKADQAEYDLRFLGREYGITDLPILRQHELAGPVAECMACLNHAR